MSDSEELESALNTMVNSFGFLSRCIEKKRGGAK